MTSDDSSYFGIHVSCLHDITGIESTSIENIGWLEDYEIFTTGSMISLTDISKHQLIEHNKH